MTSSLYSSLHSFQTFYTYNLLCLTHQKTLYIQTLSIHSLASFLESCNSRALLTHSRLTLLSLSFFFPLSHPSFLRLSQFHLVTAFLLHLCPPCFSLFLLPFLSLPSSLSFLATLFLSLLSSLSFPPTLFLASSASHLHLPSLHPSPFLLPVLSIPSSLSFPATHVHSSFLLQPPTFIYSPCIPLPSFSFSSAFLFHSLSLALSLHPFFSLPPSSTLPGSLSLHSSFPQSPCPSLALSLSSCKLPS